MPVFAEAFSHQGHFSGKILDELGSVFPFYQFQGAVPEFLGPVFSFRLFGNRQVSFRTGYRNIRVYRKLGICHIQSPLSISDIGNVTVAAYQLDTVVERSSLLVIHNFPQSDQWVSGSDVKQ